MLKQFVFVLTVLFCSSIIGFAQNKNEGLKDPHHKTDTVKVQKVEDSKETVSKEPWNKVARLKEIP